MSASCAPRASRRPVPPPSLRKVREKYANGLGKTDSEILAFVAEAGVVTNSDVAERMGMSISGARKALQLLIDAGVVTNSDVAERMGMSVSGARKALQRLIDAGLVVREGQGKRTRYMPSEEDVED